jgi:GGDEF domain-containing protein
MFLRVLDGPHTGRWFDCSRGPLILGRRMPPSHVLLMDESSVGRGSVSIERVAGGYVLWDESENGSFVNGRHVHGAQVPIEPGDELRIGKTRLTLCAERSEEGDFPRAPIPVDPVKLEQVARLRSGLGPEELLDFLLNMELLRAGLPDRLTGAGSVHKLLQAVPGAPPSSLGWGPAWGSEWRGLSGRFELWMIAVDVLGLARINDRSGLAAGDEVLRQLAAAMKRATPERGPLMAYRIHGDAFATLFASEVDLHAVQQATERLFQEGLERAVNERAKGVSVELTFASLHLVIEQPYAPVLLGPLVCAELERALVVARVSRKSEIQRRHIDLRGYVEDGE